jgi:hypothetical protein
MGWNDHIDDRPSHECNRKGKKKRFYYGNGVFNAFSEDLTELERVGGCNCDRMYCKHPMWIITYRCNFCGLVFKRGV